MLQKQIKVAIADDHQIFRTGVKIALSDKRNLEIIWEAKDGQDLMSKMFSEIPDVLIMDISMPEITGIEAIKILRKDYHDIKIIVLSSFDDEQTINKMMELGANAYLTKTTSPTEIYKAILECMFDDYYFNPVVTNALLSKLRHSKNTGNLYKSDIPVQFNEKEIKIMQLAAQDRNTKEISELIFLSPRTIETIRQKMKEKVSAKTTAGLVMYGLRNRLINY